MREGGKIGENFWLYGTSKHVVLIPQMSVILCCCCCCCYSDEDDGDTLDWLPMAPEIEDPEEPGWGQLKVNQLYICS